jgi:hypothetical protein
MALPSDVQKSGETSDSFGAIELVLQEGLDSSRGYNDFMMKRLVSYVDTDFALIVQWDGFVLNHDKWHPSFFEYDYIGAVWPWMPTNRQVGNGGFSLRSKRLLRALRDPRIISHHPEDLAICQTYRNLLERDYDIRFAPPQIATRFAFERQRNADSFGFHGFYNFHLVFPPDELRLRLADLPLFVFGSIDATELAYNLFSRGDEQTAKDVLKRVLRFKHGGEIPGQFQSI